MVDEKKWFHSTTIWGALVAVAASFSSVFGLSIEVGRAADQSRVRWLIKADPKLIWMTPPRLPSSITISSDMLPPYIVYRD